MASYRNEDLTDRELLHIINDIAGDGTVTSADIGLALGVRPDGDRSAARVVATRLAWMKRYGFLIRIDPREVEGRKGTDPVEWMISDIGRQIMSGKLPKALEQQLDRATAGNQVLLMRKLTQRAYVEAGPEVATAVRREYLHNAAKRAR